MNWPTVSSVLAGRTSKEAVEGAVAAATVKSCAYSWSMADGTGS